MGNYYEFHFVLKAFLDVIESDVTSFKYEPYGEEEQGVDLQINHQENILAYQCKSRNGSSDKWTLGAFVNHKIFKNWEIQFGYI